MLPNHIKSLLGECIKSKRCMLDSALVALVAAVFFCLILPTQSYLACADLFPYEYSSLFWALIWRCALVGLTLFVLLSLSYFRCRGLVHILLLSLVVAGILESGPLAIGLPELNGDMAGYQSLTRKLVDSSVLVLALILPFVLLKYIRQYAGWISVALLFYSSLSLLDVKQNGKKDASDLESYMAPRVDVVKSVEYSDRDNVFVLILDSISVDAVLDIFDTDAKLREDFSGFVHYANNVGMHWYTTVAVPGIMTGELYEKAIELADYGMAHFSKASFVADYINSGIPSFVNLDLGLKGCTNRLRQNQVHTDCESILEIRMPGTAPWTIDDISKFRVLPYCFKEKFFLSHVGTETETKKGLNVGRKSISADTVVWSELAGKSINSRYAKTLQVHHSKGGHLPIVYDADGNSVVRPKPEYDDYVKQCHYAFRLLGNYFDKLKRLGVYDNSTIILLGDHGLSIRKPGKDLKGVPQAAFPFLMVKPRGAVGAETVSQMPTWHGKIAPLARLLITDQLNRNSIEKVLACSNRVCRVSSYGMLTEWQINATGGVFKVERKDCEPSPETLRPLECGRRYLFKISTAGKDYPDFSLENGSRNSSVGIHNAGDPFVLTVKAPKANHKYGADFKASLKLRNKVVAKCGRVEVLIQGQNDAMAPCAVVFPPQLESDADGLLRFSFSCSRKSASFCLKQMTLIDAGSPSSQRRISVPIDTHVRLSSTNETCRVVKLDPKGSRIALRGNVTYTGNPRNSQKAVVMLIRFLDGNNKRIEAPLGLSYSKMFDDRFFYVGVNDGGTAFSREIDIPDNAEKLQLRAFRFTSGCEVDIQNLACEIVK